MMSWSRVKHFPPAFTILALAVSVNLRAAIVILGTSRSLLSSVTVATATTILFLKVRLLRVNGTYCPFRFSAILEIEIGGLFTLDEMSLLKIVLQKADSVLLDRNLNSFTKHDKLWEIIQNLL
jgi:hypothetical protein